MVHPLPSLRFPEQFQGFFRRTKHLYAPMLQNARNELAAFYYPSIADSFYGYVVRENPQPSFMLLPLMFLGVADASGGIQQTHRNYLPIMLLVMEICAVMDDTTDRTPQRSGRPTFAAAYGDHSATPLTASLVSTALTCTVERAPELLKPLTELLVELGARELWEIHNRYPDFEVFPNWLNNRYAQVTPALTYALNGAVLLNGHDILPYEVNQRFARIFQDVDDIVNVAEMREHAGENDDFKVGMVTLPLLATLQAEPSLRSDVRQLWDAYSQAQARPIGVLSEELIRINQQYEEQFERVHKALMEIGVPATLRQVIEDAELCVAASPSYIQPLMEELVLTFVDRVRPFVKV